MKSNRTKESLFYPFENMVMSLYLFVMLAVFPVYYRYQYAKMGDSKYQIFLYATVICVPVLFLCLLGRFLMQSAKQKKSLAKEIRNVQFSLLDKAIFLYFLCTSISYLFCDFKKDGFFGADGWNMGYLSQLLFIGIYWAVSATGRQYRVYLSLLMVSSAIVFLVGVLHRFDIDILRIYGDLELYYKVQFLSTIGQSSWYSSFLCTVFPVGLYVFFLADKRPVRVATGIYSAMAMCTLVTQNTDSAFLALFTVIFVLFYLSFDGERERLRFLEVLILIFASFTLMGIFQRVFFEKMIPLDSLSVFMTQSFVSPILLAICTVIYLFGRKKTPQSDEHNAKAGRKIFWITLVVAGVGVFLTILFILLNSTGLLYTHFGYKNVNNYLLFSDDWGNSRGFAWRFTCEMYGDLPFWRKWIGVGPECYSFYIESIPKYAQQMKDFWGNLALTNAHNEYLTKLFNLGIAGLLAYVFMLGSAVYTFVKYRKEQMVLPAFALCVVSYATHNIFCYEQVCCTPFVYILMGFGNYLLHETQKKQL